MTLKSNSVSLFKLSISVKVNTFVELAFFAKSNTLVESETESELCLPLNVASTCPFSSVSRVVKSTKTENTLASSIKLVLDCETTLPFTMTLSIETSKLEAETLPAKIPNISKNAVSIFLIITTLP